jgi:hypothetical protein
MARKLARRGKVRASSAGKASRRRAAKATRRPARSARRGARPKTAARAKARTKAKAKPSPKKRAAKIARKTAGKGAVKRAAARSKPAKAARTAPSLDRSRRRLPELENNIPTPPSSLDMDRTPTAARSGRQAALAARAHHTETGPELTGGDVDADWEDAYAVGDEAPGGDNPTPDQDRVDDIGRALGVEYQDNEELKGGDKISGRDKHRWELDPASAEDYNDRDLEEE